MTDKNDNQTIDEIVERIASLKLSTPVLVPWHGRWLKIEPEGNYEFWTQPVNETVLPRKT